MKKVLLQALMILVGIGGLNAFGCSASLVKDVSKKGKVVPIKTREAFKKCVGTDPAKLAIKNPNFTAELDHTCTSDPAFKKKFKAQCAIAAKADPDSTAGAGAGAGDDDDSGSACSALLLV